MQRSQGIQTMAQRFAEAIRRRDLGALDAVIAGGDDVLFIGTDPDEWWTGHETIMSLYEQQLAAMDPDGLGLGEFEVTAYEQGDGGWFAGRTAFLASGEEVPVRISGCASRDGGDWRIVHLHVSIGIPNEQVVGRELPT